MLEYYSTLNISAVPDRIVKAVVSNVKPFTINQNNQLHLRLRDGTTENSAVYNRDSLDQVCIDWMIEHIPELENIKCTFGYQFIDAVTNTSGWFVPHTDGKFRGSYVLSYILDTGSDSIVSTHWWKEHGRDSHRAPHIFINDYRKLDELKSVIIPANTWHMLDASILHSVHGIKTRRTAITVGFNDKELVDLILSKYKS